MTLEKFKNLTTQNHINNFTKTLELTLFNIKEINLIHKCLI